MLAPVELAVDKTTMFLQSQNLHSSGGKESTVNNYVIRQLLIGVVKKNKGG